MLRGEGGPHPAKLAYDRPSTKLIGFLAKHYGLKNYVPQTNNYIVFNQYWEANPKPINLYQPFVPPNPGNAPNPNNAPNPTGSSMSS